MNSGGVGVPQSTNPQTIAATAVRHLPAAAGAKIAKTIEQ